MAMGLLAQHYHWRYLSYYHHYIPERARLLDLVDPIENQGQTHRLVWLSFLRLLHLLYSDCTKLGTHVRLAREAYGGRFCECRCHARPPRWC